MYPIKMDALPRTRMDGLRARTWSVSRRPGALDGFSAASVPSVRGHFPRKQKNMAVRIRLRRTGKRNAPAHRIVVTDGRSPRDGRYIEILGHYDPRNKDEKIDVERAEYWLSQGAQPSETVAHIIERAKTGKTKVKKALPVQQAKAPKVQKLEESEAVAEAAAQETTAADSAAAAEKTAEAPVE